MDQTAHGEVITNAFPISDGILNAGFKKRRADLLFLIPAPDPDPDLGLGAERSSGEEIPMSINDQDCFSRCGISLKIHYSA
jgi:hypothetical protein